MNNDQGGRPTTGRIIGATALAVALGLLLPVITLMQVMSLCPVILLGGVLTAYFYCAVGWVPTAAFVGAQLASTALLTGPAMMGMELAAAVLPGVLLIPGYQNRRPFFDQMRTALMLYFAGMVAAVFIAYASFGGNMIQRFMDVMRQQFRFIPDAALAPFVDAVNAALSGDGTRAIDGITVSDYRASLMGVLDLMQQTYGQMLPGALLSGALVSAVLTVLWGNWRMAMKGDATARSFVGMSQWFLPAQVAVGMLILWAVSYALAQGGISSGSAVYATVHQLSCFTFLFQALASLDRRYSARGMTLKWRRVVIGISLTLALISRDIATLLMILGILSALFGSHGIARKLMMRNEKDDGDPGDPDE